MITLREIHDRTRPIDHGPLAGEIQRYYVRRRGRREGEFLDLAPALRVLEGGEPVTLAFWANRGNKRYLCVSRFGRRDTGQLGRPQRHRTVKLTR